MFFDQSATRLRAPIVTDRHNNRARNWEAASRMPIVGVAIQPFGRAEQNDAGSRDRITSGWTLQTPPGRDLDLLATDRVELSDGVVCEVLGEVARHMDPFGRGVHHVEVALQRTTG
jgi:hypothetical protein